VPEHQHPIDPLSERLGELRADVRAINGHLDSIEARMARLATTAELRVWGGLVLAGLSVLGWLVTHR
jgi:hypothetical protein